VLIWTLLAVFSFSFVPSASFAQQPTATISALSGEVLVSGQSATAGTALRAGDTIQTQAGASAVLELSDGSEIQLGEKTQINIDDLSQTATGARVSSIKLLAGWLRAFLSSEHQQEGSSFTIETPNAQLGVKFSQPDVEVSYDPAKQETIGIARTVELLAKNLLTGETKLVPVGSTVIITAVGIKVIAGIVGVIGSSSVGTTGTGSVSTGPTGMGTGTKVAIGAGAAAAAGGIAVLVANTTKEEEEENSPLFTGTFVNTRAPSYKREVYDLVQTDSSVTINYSIDRRLTNCCSLNFTHQATGTVNNGELVFSFPAKEEQCPCPEPISIFDPFTNTDCLTYNFGVRIEGGNYTATLSTDGNTLMINGPPCIYTFDILCERNFLWNCVGTGAYEHE